MGDHSKDASLFNLALHFIVGTSLCLPPPLLLILFVFWEMGLLIKNSLKLFEHYAFRTHFFAF